jgi:SNF2 family DNA or RNA helicase
MSFKGELYGFQAEALKFLLERRQALLALEMGLGKTVITIAAAEELLDRGEIATAMVVAPASLKYQWKRMIETFTSGAVTIKLVEGPPARRQLQYAHAMAEPPDWLILNYEQVVNDFQYVKALPMDCVIADEVQAIKSFRSKRSRRVKRLRSTYRWGLSGQPLENRPEEVYSIFQWIDPDLLGRFEVFDKTFIVRNSFGGVKFYRNLPTLHRRLSSAMVRKRRDDPDVRDQLPKVTEEIIPVPFDPAGAKLYRYIVKDLLAELTAARQYGNFNVFAHYSPTAHDDPASAAARGRIMSRLTCLRMLCDHPALLRWSATQFDKAQGSGSAYAAELAADGLLDGLGPAPKFEATKALLREIDDAGHKTALFSFFKESLHLLRHDLEELRPVLFTGDQTPAERDKARQKFAHDDHCRLFLSSDAGGVGLDLPQASYLINYNLPWSAGKFDQRQARIIRLSSEWESVTLVTVVMAGSIEERMYDMLMAKRAVADAVVDGRGIDAKGRLVLNVDTLTDFLTHSAV